MTRLQPKEKKEMYDFDDENKKSVEKKIESLFRHIKRGLRGLRRQEFASVSPTLDINTAGQGFAPVFPSFYTKTDLKGLADPRFTSVFSAFDTKLDLADPRFAFVS